MYAGGTIKLLLSRTVRRLCGGWCTAVLTSTCSICYLQRDSIFAMLFGIELYAMLPATLRKLLSLPFTLFSRLKTPKMTAADTMFYLRLFSSLLFPQIHQNETPRVSNRHYQYQYLRPIIKVYDDHATDPGWGRQNRFRKERWGRRFYDPTGG